MASSPRDPAPYVPIACSYYDRLEHHAVRGAPVEVVYQAAGATRAVTAVLADLFSRDAVEYARLAPADGTPAFDLRLDRLVSIGGVARPGAC